MTSQDDHVLTYFGERGFECWSTGGGGEAVAARVGECYVLITDEDGMGLPVEGKPVCVGIYSDSLGEGFEYAVVSSFDEAVSKANELIEKYAG